MTRFCVYCGRPSTPDNPVVNGVCLQCRLERGEAVIVVKDTLRYDLCRVCGSVKIGYRWRDTHGFEEAIDLIVKEEVEKYVRPGPGVEWLRVSRYEYDSEPDWHTRVRVFFEGSYGGKIFEAPVLFNIFFNPSKCPRCSMVDSGEFEAVIKIRGVDADTLRSVLDREFSRDRRIARDLVDALENQGGVDLYFYSHGAARKLARKLSARLGLRIMEDYEVAGMRSGRQRARLIISLRPGRRSHR